MGLETFIGTYIDGLNTDWPADDDTIDDGNEHIAGMKLVLQNTFPGITGEVTATHTELNYLDITTLGTAAASKALVADGSANIDCGALTFTDLGTVTTADINGGTWQGTIDGNWTAAAQTCADLGTVSDADFTQLTLGGSAAMTAIETTLAGSATKLARADAIKTYVDSDRANAVSAYLKCTGTLSTTQTLITNYNSEFTSVTKTATGRYTVVMANARTDYVVSLTPVKSTDCVSYVDVLTSTTEFKIKFIDSFGTFVNPDYIFITVHGQKS